MSAVLTPSAQFVGDWPVASPEWHAARQNGLGGSEIAAVLGLSPWESRFSLWHRKRGSIGGQVENSEMDAGKRLEPAICDKFADDHPEFVVMRCGTFRHPDRPWQIANPDRLLFSTGTCRGNIAVCREHEHPPVALLEAKLALYPDEWGQQGTDQIPPYYLAQCRWYLDVFTLDRIHIEVFIGAAGEFREYLVQRDDADQQLMRDAALEFLESIARDERPDIDAHSATYQAVRELHPDIDPIDVEIDPVLAQDYQNAYVAAAAADAVKQQQVSRMLDAMGQARRAVCLGEQIALRIPGRGDNPPFLRPCRPSKKAATP